MIDYSQIEIDKRTGKISNLWTWDNKLVTRILRGPTEQEILMYIEDNLDFFEIKENENYIRYIKFEFKKIGTTRN
jgi:hypothetical protein